MIKYSTTFLFLFLLGLNGLYGQNRKAVRSETAKLRMMAPAATAADPRLSFRVEQDTVNPTIFADDCSLDLFNYVVNDPSWGLIGGTNGYFDVEKAQRLGYTPSSAAGFFVREIWGWFGYARVVGDGDIFAKVYTLDPGTQGPGNVTAFSQVLKTSELVMDETESLPTVFTIENPLTIRENTFFASFDFSQLYEAQDTVGLFQTEDGCGDGSDSWERWGDGTWTAIDAAGSWELESNFAISAVVEPTNLIQELIEAPVFQEDTCSNSLVAFFSNPWGFVGGTNGFGDLEKAQLLTFDTDADVSVREIWGWFYDVQTVDDGPVSAKVYALNQNGDGPGDLLGSSASLKTSELTFSADAILPTPFVFEAPVPVNDIAFYASIDFSELYATKDTVGLWQTDDGCGDGSTSWELFNDGVTWTNISASNSWGLNANWLISAIIEFNTTTDVDDQLAFVAQNGLQLYPAFPNPAAETVNLKYQLDSSERVRIEVYSAEGRLLQQHDLGRQMTGEHTETIDVSTLPAGAYVYGIVTEQSRLMSRFVVGR